MNSECHDDCPAKPVDSGPALEAFHSDVVDRVRRSGNELKTPGGQVLLPRVFGFCRGVKRALAMLQEAVDAHKARGTRLFLLGEIIHNPWVNDHFRQQGVQILSGDELAEMEQMIRAEDCCVIPAFGIPLPLERRLGAMGCEVIDTSCGDVRRLWEWSRRAVEQGFGVLIFGRASHDETVVTKSRIQAAGGKYVVVGNLQEARKFCDLITGVIPAEQFPQIFQPEATNAKFVDSFARLAQVSQTTMLYDETMKVRHAVESAIMVRYGGDGIENRWLPQPTVCRATQDRQNAAVELCRSGLDLVLVVGGFGSSNTRHLHELAGRYAPAYFIETAEGIISRNELETLSSQTQRPAVVSHWLPDRRPLRIGVLAGASSPEIVVGKVLQKLADFLSK